MLHRIRGISSVNLIKLKLKYMAHVTNLSLYSRLCFDWTLSIFSYLCFSLYEGKFICIILPCNLSTFISSFQLAKALEAQEKETKRKAKRDANLSKARRTKADWSPLWLFQHKFLLQYFCWLIHHVFSFSSHQYILFPSNLFSSSCLLKMFIDSQAILELKPLLVLLLCTLYILSVFI